MDQLEAERFLKARGVCVCCHLNHACCDAGAPDDVARHWMCWRAGHVRPPWWSAIELVRIIQGSELKQAMRDARARGHGTPR